MIILSAIWTFCDGGSCRHPCSHAATMRVTQLPSHDTTRCRVSVHLSEIFSGIQQLQTISSVYQAPLFTLLHTNLNSRFTFILGLGYTAHYWIWGQPIIGHNFLTIAKNCKKSAAPGQAYCSVGDTKSWNNKMISNKKLRVVCIFAGAQIWQV